ncbi:MAG: hypothetical protein ABJD53_16645 [Gammaproteobacteria bacterium]
MAKPINTPVTGNIWHLSIDDLFAPLPEKTRLGGPGPFVINLSVSTAPIDLPPKSFDSGREAHVYQVQRTEDRRMRYRLRLGPFANEDDADIILDKVRNVYPGALTATADADDLRAIATLQAKTASGVRINEPVKAAQAVKTVEPKKVAEAVTLAIEPVSLARAGEPKPVAKKAEPAPAPKVIEAAPLVLSLLEEPAAAPPAPVSTATAVPRVPPVLRDRVFAPPPMPAPAVVAPPKPAAPAPRNARSASGAAGIPAAPIEQSKNRLLSVESTQTVRALTMLELQSEQASRWFVIQLSLSEEAFDSEAVPNLDIFDVYRLYSVAGIDQGRIVHALRLGFFGEENAAAAVASYLSGFYDNPTVKRVSSAERERFADQRFEPRKDVGATGMHAVIEITDERYIREKRNTSARAASQNNK